MLIFQIITWQMGERWELKSRGSWAQCLWTKEEKMLYKARLIASFSPQQLFLVSVLWGEVPYSSWGARCSQAASQGPGAWTRGSPEREITLSLLLLLDKRLCPSQLLLRGASARSWGRQRGEMSVLPPSPAQLSNPVVAMSRVCRNVI